MCRFITDLVIINEMSFFLFYYITKMTETDICLLLIILSMKLVFGILLMKAKLFVKNFIFSCVHLFPASLRRIVTSCQFYCFTKSVRGLCFVNVEIDDISVILMLLIMMIVVNVFFLFLLIFLLIDFFVKVFRNQYDDVSFFTRFIQIFFFFF